MGLNKELIDDLIRYKKGESITDPNGLVNLHMFFGYKNVFITRRSIAHILQKEKVGVVLLQSIDKCIEDFDNIFLSDKNKNMDDKRFILFKRDLINSRDIAVVIEYKDNSEYVFVVTAMIADEKYLSRKYKKLR